MNKETKETIKDLKTMGRTVRGVGVKMSAFSAILVGLGIGAVAQSAKFEQLGVSLEVLTGSAARGQKLLKELTKFAAETPFQLEGIVESAKTLLAFGIETDNISDTLRRLGDLAAGTGKPLSEFALIFGKIKAKGKITGEELQQLAEKGINLREALGKKFNMNALQVEKAISKGQVTFEHVRDVIVQMTSEGGRFFDMMAKQSRTTSGLWSTLKDNIALAAREIGDVLKVQFKIDDVMKGLIGRLSAFTEGFKEWVRMHPLLFKVALAVTVFAAAVGPLLLMIGTLITLAGTVQFALAALGLTFGAVALPVLAVVAAVGLLITAGVMLALAWNDIKLFFKLLGNDLLEFVGKIGASVGAFVTGVRERFESLRSAITDFFTTGTIGTVLEFVGVTSGAGGASQTDINVVVRSQEGTVESASAVTSGDSGVNVGLNMEPL